MKLTKSQIKQIIKEELAAVLNEGENIVTYKITDHFRQEGLTVDEAAEIKLPSGEPVFFLNIVKELSGQTFESDEGEWDDETGEFIPETFTFTLGAYEGDTEEEQALDVLESGQGPFYIDEWAKKNGFAAAEGTSGGY
jgi:hypothetical protein